MPAIGPFSCRRSAAPSAPFCDTGRVDLDDKGHSGLDLTGAIRDGNTDAVRSAIESGARPLEPQAGIGPVVRWAAEWGRSEIVQTLLDGGEPLDEYALVAAAGHGHTSTVRVLLDAGADVDVPHSWTPLMAAAQCGWHETVTALLEAGANVSLRSSDEDPLLPGMTALEIALVHGNRLRDRWYDSPRTRSDSQVLAVLEGHADNAK